MNENTASQIFKKIDSGTIVEIAAILIAVTLLILLLQKALPWIANRLPGKQRLFLLATVPLLRLALILIAFLIVIPLLVEPSFQNMIAFLGTVGVALGFALKDYVGSLIAGVVSIGEQTYRNGDWVQIGDVYGEVRHVGMRTVSIVTPEDDRVLVPHNQLWNVPISNANNGSARLQCVTDFYLAPEHDAARARALLEDVALTSPYLFFGTPIAVIVAETPWSTHYRLKAYPVDSAMQFRFRSDLTVRGKTALRSEGFRFANAMFATNSGQ
ncbi:MAG TPA: mechanosensitive ion channel protein MscS [Marinobacter sp.]|jgi:small-conductance mechanosensitive channel|uniref:mechanosensitive ion channel family protein n=1 Tax=Marinobacter sp. TaxID=50741 RepID=UPI000EB9F273|nr:mechanosensitive ion channel domain-containing protein [Marinobacter sp.]MBC7193471.1 mechanosensitive ion channel [Marinobacter sp.]HCW91897.1 mechanosensitive ion channel protein MscS [Marinobacter sp.]